MIVKIKIDKASTRRMTRLLRKEAPAAFRRASTRFHQRAGQLVGATARDFCPESPSKGQHKGSLKGGKSKRTNLQPGNLRRSIQVKSGVGFTEIFIPDNSLGGKYARYIHDAGPNGTGKWHNPGAGTRAKAGAGDKFFDRAVEKHKRDLEKMYEQELQREVNKLNTGV